MKFKELEKGEDFFIHLEQKYYNHVAHKLKDLGYKWVSNRGLLEYNPTKRLDKFSIFIETKYKECSWSGDTRGMSWTDLFDDEI